MIALMFLFKRCCLVITVVISCSTLSAQKGSRSRNDLLKTIKQTLQPTILKKAEWALQQQPVTVTASYSPRSSGGRHDFFSEGDYWWPNPKGVDSPWVSIDGKTNPGNFVEHRHAMIRFSEIVGSLASAYILKPDEKYAKQILLHCKAWFMDTATRMNPNLLYSQAVKNRYTGRSFGVIDGIHLMEVVKGLEVIEKKYPAADKAIIKASKQWFQQFLQWLNTHKYGVDEKNALNNHSTCWAMQVAVFANFAGDKASLDTCRFRFKNIILPRQMGADGSLPLELARTKPYGYSIFNLDAMTTLCQELSTASENLYDYEIDGRSIRKGITFLYPYIADKSKWTWPKDIMYWDNWPVAQPFLVFGAVAYDNADWLKTWQSLDHAPTVEEVIRNVPVRNPLIWFNIP
jgi:hypothetical protein